MPQTARTALPPSDRAWITVRPDRAGLVRWLGDIAQRTGGQFYRQMLVNLMDYGCLTSLQEAAARLAWQRADRGKLLSNPALGQWAPHGGRRRIAHRVGGS